MSRDETSVEDKLIALLAEYDEALAAGETRSEVAGAGEGELQRDLAYLGLLR